MDAELLIIIGSGIFILVGAKLWQRGNHLIHNGKKAKAVIFKNNFKRSGSDGGMYYPVVRFTTESNEWITQELNIGYSPAKPEGTKLEVIYDPDDPTNVDINGTFQLEVLPRLFVAIGLVGFILSLLEYLEIIDVFTIA